MLVFKQNLPNYSVIIREVARPLRISTRGRYGLRAMVDMAFNTLDGPVTLHEVAKRQGVSESYLEQVFANLRKAGLVTAQRGAQGGYELGRSAIEITVGDVLRALEGSIAPVHCVDRIKAGRHCERESFCATRPFWEQFRDHINSFLDATTLQELADRARLAEGKEPMYFI